MKTPGKTGSHSFISLRPQTPTTSDGTWRDRRSGLIRREPCHDFTGIFVRRKHRIENLADDATDDNNRQSFYQLHVRVPKCRQTQGMGQDELPVVQQLEGQLQSGMGFLLVHQGGWV